MQIVHTCLYYHLLFVRVWCNPAFISDVRATAWLSVLDAGADLTLGYKGLSLGPPISGGPKILGIRTISNISVRNYIFVLVQRTFFYYAANKRSL